MTDREWLAAILKDAMGDMTKTEAAEKAGISRNMLWKLLSGRVSPTVDLLFQIVRGWNRPEIWGSLGLRH